jgi:hypothetical protein
MLIYRFLQKEKPSHLARSSQNYIDQCSHPYNAKSKILQNLSLRQIYSRYVGVSNVYIRYYIYRVISC